MSSWRVHCHQVGHQKNPITGMTNKTKSSITLSLSRPCFLNHLFTPLLFPFLTIYLFCFINIIFIRVFHLPTNIVFECPHSSGRRGVTSLFSHHLTQLCREKRMGFGFSTIVVFHVGIHWLFFFSRRCPVVRWSIGTFTSWIIIRYCYSFLSVQFIVIFTAVVING